MRYVTTLIADHGHTRILITCMDEADVQTIIRTPSGAGRL
jgi:hypothetical protein